MGSEREIILKLKISDALLLQRMILSSRVNKEEEERAYEILSRLQAEIK